MGSVARKAPVFSHTNEKQVRLRKDGCFHFETPVEKASLKSDDTTEILKNEQTCSIVVEHETILRAEKAQKC